MKSYALFLTALAACAPQHPVVLAPVRMETPGDDTTAAAHAVPVFDTQRADPFATTNRIDWPGPNRYRSSADVLDIGIDSVSTRTSEGQTFANIALHRMTSIPFPVRLRVAYPDGTTQDFSLPVNIWARGNRFDAVIPVRGTITGVRLWPDPTVPDWNPSNDTWGNAPPANPSGPVTRR